MENILIHFINQFSYLGVFLLICIENLFPPIPSEIILTFSGFITIKNHLNIYYMILSASLGSWIGAELLYLFGYYLQPEKFNKYLERLKFDFKHIESANTWFHKYGNRTVFLCRFIPIIRSLISIPAGMSKMNHLPFAIYTILGSLIWNTVLIYIGTILGEQYQLIHLLMDQYSILIFLFIVLFLAIYILKKRKN